MKKFYLMWLLTILLVGSQIVMADVVTTTRKIQRIPETSQQQQTRKRVMPKVEQKITPVTIPATKDTKLSKSVKNCKRYTETLDSTISGVDFNFKISILGWVDNKCRVDFVAQSTGINQMFSSLYGMDPSMAEITTFEPKVRCEFTKQQLEKVGDSILQEEERSNGGGRMLKDPTTIPMPSLSNMSGSDLDLMNVITKEQACTILNAPDSNAMFNSLFGY
ncbi:hypothetical protein J6A34_03755 [bacterium]|nr:hypothetical protein [bacterium]